MAGTSGASGTDPRLNTTRVLIPDNEKLTMEGSRRQEKTETPLPPRDSHRIEVTQNGLPGGRKPNKAIPGNRIPWTKSEQVEVMWCYHYCRLTGKDNYIAAYKLWRGRNPNIRPNIDANKLQNQRRYIQQHHKIAPAETAQIIENIQREIADNNQQQDTTEIRHLSTDNTKNEDELGCEIRKLYKELSDRQIFQRETLPKLQLTSKVKRLITITNEVLPDIISEENVSDIESINTLTYAAAHLITFRVIKKKEKKEPEISSKQRWERRLESKISNTRKELSNLTHIFKNKLPRDSRKAKDLLKKHNVDIQYTLVEAIESLKQKLLATSQRLRRYKKRQEQYIQNKTFESNPRQFYRKIRENQIEASETPDQVTIENFWRNIYEDERTHNKNAKWIKEIEKEKRTKMRWNQISNEEVKLAINSTHNWKAPGIDKLPNLWWKQLTAMQIPLTCSFNKVIEGKEVVPDWLAKGKTFLLPKTKNTKDPKNYRPITCLNTVYKIFTKVIANRLSQYIKTNNLLPIEQKGCCKGALGCKDQLMFSKAVLEDCVGNGKNLCLGWIDYKKAYDSVPHSWLLKSLELVGTPTPILDLCRKLISTWTTTLILNGKKERVETHPIKIKRGIYQGDSLSPILFVIAMAPLSKLLNKEQGYKMVDSPHNISHLIYMDDLKLIAPSQNKLQTMLKIVQSYSNDICMNFGLEKCAVATFRKGKLYNTENIELEGGESIRSLEQGEFYKYLGVQEGTSINHAAIKMSLRTEYVARVRKILKTNLNSRNKILAIGALALPVLEYSFGVIDWTINEIREMDTKTRKQLNIHGMQHPRADVDRLYVPRARGGRGLRQIERTYHSAVFSIGQYIRCKADSDYVIHAVYTHDRKKGINKSLTKTSTKIGTSLGIAVHNNTVDQKEAVKKQLAANIEKAWLEKNMHGQLARQMQVLSANNFLSYGWLRHGKMKGETESLLVAAQEQALRTHHTESRIYKIRKEGLCRLCKKYNETVEHISSACPILAEREYLDRHNKVCTAIHFELCKAYGVAVSAKNWYEHSPSPVTVNGEETVTILYDQPIRTDREIPSLRPDIVVRARDMCCIIDVSIPADRHITRKEAEKNLKYKSLQIELQRMWGKKTTIIPVVIGATGYVSSNILGYLEKIPGKHDFYNLQRIALYGTAHILRKVLT